MFAVNGKGRFAVSTALLTLCLVASVMGASVEIPTATTLKLKAPVSGSVYGTKLDWGTFDSYKNNNFQIDMFYKARMESYNYVYCGWAYGTATWDATFTIDNAWPAGSAVSLFKVNNQGADRFTVLGDGRLVTSEDQYKHRNYAFPSSDKLIVDGNARIYGVLDFSAAPYQYAGPCNGLIRPRKYQYYELANMASYGGVYEGDLAYCSEANPSTGELVNGNGSWVVYDSYMGGWRTLALGGA